MPTQTQTRRDTEAPTRTGLDLALSIALHLAAAAAVIGAAYLHHTNKPWGDQSPTVGAIQASMVSSLPLPPKQPVLEDKVLASETPSPAPITAKEKTIPPPQPKEIPIPEKQAPKPLKQTEKPTQQAVNHPDIKPTTKAQTGETSGLRIAQSTIQLKNGSAAATVQDRTFGARFAYYVEAVNRRVSQNWLTQEADPRASEGRRVTILFDIDREGTPSNVRIETRSGSPTLDTSAVRAVQRVDAFGPLPQGDHITVEFAFDYKHQ